MIPFQRNKFIPAAQNTIQRNSNPFAMTLNQPSLPQMQGPGPKDLFGARVNPNQPLPVPVQEPEKPFDFADEYDKISSNRPNRLAYQKAVEEGAPQIERSKWAKLGAMLAAGGAGLGGTRAPEAAQFGISSYYQPQSRSDEQYERKIKGLEKLSSFEDSDVQERIRMLENQRSDWFKTREDFRQQEELGLRRTDAERQGRLTNVQIANIESEMKNRGWSTVEGEDGWTYRVNEATGERTRLIKSGATREEEFAELEKELKLKAGYDADSDARRARSAAEVARIGATSREGIAAENRKARIEEAKIRNQAAGAGLFGDKQLQQAWADLSQKVSTDPTLEDVDLADYVTPLDKGGVKALQVKPYDGWTTESEKSKKIRAALRAIIGTSLSNSVAGNTSAGRPNLATGKSDPLGIR